MNRFTAIGIICLAAAVFGRAPAGANEVGHGKDAPFQISRQVSSGAVPWENSDRETGDDPARILVLAQVADGWSRAAPRQAQAAVDKAWAMIRSRDDRPAYVRDPSRDPGRKTRPNRHPADRTKRLDTDTQLNLLPLFILITAQKRIDTIRASNMIDSAVNLAKDMADPDLRSHMQWGLTDAWADLDRHRAASLAASITQADDRARAHMAIGVHLASEHRGMAEQYFTRAWECAGDLENGLEKIYLLSQLALAWWDLDERSGQLLFEETERLALGLDEPDRSRGLKYIAYQWARRDPKQAFEMDRVIKWPSHGERGRYFLNHAFRTTNPADKTLFLNHSLEISRKMPAGPVREERIGRILCCLGSLDPNKTLALLETDLIYIQRIRDDILGSAALGLAECDPDLALESAGRIHHPHARAATRCQLAQKLFDKNRMVGLALLKQAEWDAAPLLGIQYSQKYHDLEERNRYLLGCCFSAWSLYSPVKATGLLEKYSHIRLGTDRIVLAVGHWLDRKEIENAEAAQNQALRFLTALPPVPRASALKDLAQVWLPVDPDRAETIFNLAYHTLVGQN